jgi:hypothetical protein
MTFEAVYTDHFYTVGININFCSYECLEKNLLAVNKSDQKQRNSSNGELYFNGCALHRQSVSVFAVFKLDIAKVFIQTSSFKPLKSTEILTARLTQLHA